MVDATTAAELYSGCTEVKLHVFTLIPYYLVWRQLHLLFLSSLVPIQVADIIASTTLEVVPGTSLTFNWERHGFKMYIPENALEPNTSHLTMKIQASLSGNFQLPDDTELVSGIYLIDFSPEFSQPVTMKLQHCAYLEHSDQLSSLFFLAASFIQKTSPLCFKPLEGGVFSTDSTYGIIKLRHFSGVAVGRRKEKQDGRGRQKKGEKRYSAHTYYIPQTATTWLFHFTILCDLELCVQV